MDNATLDPVPTITTQTVKCWICHRFKEPSTWAALSVPIYAFAANLDKPYNIYCYGISTLFTCIAIIFREDKGENHDATN